MVAIVIMRYSQPGKGEGGFKLTNHNFTGLVIREIEAQTITADDLDILVKVVDSKKRKIVDKKRLVFKNNKLKLEGLK